MIKKMTLIDLAGDGFYKLPMKMTNVLVSLSKTREIIQIMFDSL